MKLLGQILLIGVLHEVFFVIYNIFLFYFDKIWHLQFRNPDDVYAEGDLHNIENQQEHLFRPSVTLGRDNHGNRNSTPHTATSKHLGVEELEMLLEAYFVQIDGTLNKLSTVCQTTFLVIDLILEASHFLITIL